MVVDTKNIALRSSIITMKKDLLDIKKNGFGFTKNFQTPSPAPVPVKPVEPVIQVPTPTPVKPLAPELIKSFSNPAPAPAPVKPMAPAMSVPTPAPAPVKPLAPEAAKPFSNPAPTPTPTPIIKSQKPEPYYTKPAPILRPAPVQGLRPEIKPEIKKETLSATPSTNPTSLPKPPQAVFSSFGSELMIKEPVLAPQNTAASLTPPPAPVVNPINPVIKPEIKPTKSFMEEVEELMNTDKK